MCRGGVGVGQKTHFTVCWTNYNCMLKIKLLNIILTFSHQKEILHDQSTYLHVLGGGRKMENPDNTEHEHKFHTDSDPCSDWTRDLVAANAFSNDTMLPKLEQIPAQHYARTCRNISQQATEGSVPQNLPPSVQFCMSFLASIWGKWNKVLWVGRKYFHHLDPLGDLLRKPK